MRRMLFTSAAIAAALTMGLGACGDDGDKGTTDTTQADTVSPGDTVGGDDTTGDATSNPDATGDTTGDTVVADPCTPNPCTNPPAPSCDGDGKLVTAGATGTCTANGAVAACTYPTTAVACETDEICASGACLPTGDPCEYEFAEAASVVTEIRIASLAADNSDDCCFDFNGDDKIDNKLGSTLKTAAGLVGDLNGTIKAQVDSGKLVILLEEEGLDDVTADSSITLNGFIGDPTAGAKTGADADGLGTFTASNSSFLPGTAVPLISFQSAAIAAGVLSGGPTVFTLSLPLLEGAPLVVQISMTQLEGKVTTGPNGKGLDIGAQATGDLGAKLGGVIKEVDLYEAVNSFVASSCVVVTDADNKLVSLGADGTWKCASTTASGGNPAEVDSSACDEDDPAKKLAGFCGALALFIQPDVDTDMDGKNDAISIGLWINATSATITPDPVCTPVR